MKDILKDLKRYTSAVRAQQRVNTYVSSMDRGTLESLATAALMAEWRRNRREITRAAEQRAAAAATKSQVPAPQPIPAGVGQDNLLLPSVDLEKRYAEFVSDPLRESWLSARSYRSRERSSRVAYRAAQNREIDSFESQHGDLSDEEQALVMQKDIDSHYAFVQEQEEREAERSERFLNKLNSIMEEYKAAVVLEFTEELLSSYFTLEDGTEVTWGDATVEQHAARQRMFEGNVHANLEGAARHAYAIEQLQQKNAQTLNQLTEED
jgi:hypothetical protein